MKSDLCLLTASLSLTFATTRQGIKICVPERSTSSLLECSRISKNGQSDFWHNFLLLHATSAPVHPSYLYCKHSLHTLIFIVNIHYIV
jgi:hypothetical protein